MQCLLSRWALGKCPGVQKEKGPASQRPIYFWVPDLLPNTKTILRCLTKYERLTKALRALNILLPYPTTHQTVNCRLYDISCPIEGRRAFIDVDLEV